MTTTTPATFTARSPEDLLAVVPAVLGFHPEESLVMLTFGGPRAFHARIDLPSSPDDLGRVVEALLEPAVRQRPRRVLFIAYSADAVRAAACALHASDVFLAHDFGVLAPLRSDGSCWFRVRADEDPDDAEEHPYDLGTHPLTAQSVLEGRVTLPSRSALAASLAPDPGARARVEACLAARLGGVMHAGAPPVAAEVRSLVLRHAGAATRPSDDETALLLLACRDVATRDALLEVVTRETADEHVELWRSVVSRSPELFVAAPAAVLAFCGWLAGHGALAWCATDRALAVDPDHALAQLVARLLAAAVPPSALSAVAPGGSAQPQSLPGPRLAGRRPQPPLFRHDDEPGEGRA